MVVEITPIYKPRENPVEDPMRIVALFSGGASAVPYMIGETYKVVGAISSDRKASGIGKLEKMGISVTVNDIHYFYGDGRDIRDMEIRKAYDRENLSITENWKPDVIACSGYMYFLTDVFLNAYPNRVLNVHPADLSILDESGKRKYTGDNAVKDAIEAGETFTRSTIHVMNNVVDGGSILGMSNRIPVGRKGYKEHQDLMKLACDGPAYREVLNLLSLGKFFTDSRNNVFIETYDSERNDIPAGLELPGNILFKQPQSYSSGSDESQ